MQHKEHTSHAADRSTISKEKQWQQTRLEFVDHIVDGIGTRMDKGIIDTAVALNVLDIHTLASCEGHMDHGTFAPWIDIGTDFELIDSVRQLKDQAMDIYQQGDEELATLMFQNAERMRLTVKTAQTEGLKKLMSALEEFYDDREVPLDQRLVLLIASDGFARLESQGVAFQELAPDEEKAERLIRCQSEMRAFTNFLKENFFLKNNP